jgi:quinol monooxygenase YgiN|tara:strand:+ start:153 stop:491 length:339 start_codon:yes stop_codon:yes gene_type:complete
VIIVQGSIPVRPECRDQAISMAKNMVEASRLELGCVSYDFYVGLADPNTLMLFQEWESLDALQSHFETKHMDDFLQQLPDILAGEVVTKRYAVQSIEEEEAVLVQAEEPVIH